MDKVFYFILYLSGCVCILVLWAREIKSYVFQYIFTLLICIFIGFRSKSSGADTETYLTYFEELSSGSYRRVFDVGFEWFSILIVGVLHEDIYLFSICLIQFSLIFLALYLIRIENSLACIWLFLAFMPGLDLATSIMRSFLAASLGALVFCFSVKNRRFPLLNFAPAVFHSSYLLVPLIFISPFLNLTWRRISILYAVSLALFLAFLFVSGGMLRSWVEIYVSGYGVISKLVRYVVLESDLLSPLVKFYFVFVSLSLSGLLLLISRYGRGFDVGGWYQKMCSTVMCCQCFYALISFSGLAYRFYYIYYLLQVIAVVYGLSKFVDKRWALAIYFTILGAGVVSTYTTNRFLSYEFFEFF